MAEIIFYNDNTGIEVETGVPMNYFRVGGFENGVQLDYHRLQKKMWLAIEMFINRSSCEDLDKSPTAQRWIEVDPPDLDVEDLSKAYIDTQVLAYSDVEMDLTASIRIGKTYPGYVDFGTIKEDQRKTWDRVQGQIFNVAAQHNSFDFKFGFYLGGSTGSPTGNLTCKVWDTDVSDLPLNELASLEHNPITGGLNEVEFLGLNLPKAEKYAFTIQDDGTNDALNFYRVERSLEQIYTAGDYIQNIDGAGWTAVTDRDLRGYLYRR